MSALSAMGPEGDIVLTSRVRLARNLAGRPFVNRATLEQDNEVLEQVRAALEGWQEPMSCVPMSGLEKAKRQSLVERHLISQELTGIESGALILNPEETVAIMVNEEDHLRIQSLQPGYQLRAAFEAANAVDDALEASLDFAFDEEWGYLTCCPTNVGTGMRASAMMHLPALALTRQIGTVLSTLGKIGLTIRGIYGEGTDALGCVFQVSNQVTLGVSEEDILRRVSTAVESIVRNERFARNYLREQRGADLEDKLWRSYALLTHARKLSGQEFMNFWSDAIMGTSMGILPVEVGKLLQALEQCQAATLTVRAGQEMEAAQRDHYRAERVRELLYKEA